MAKSPVLYRTGPQHSLNWHWPYSAGIGDLNSRDFQKGVRMLNAILPLRLLSEIHREFSQALHIVLSTCNKHPAAFNLFNSVYTQRYHFQGHLSSSFTTSSGVRTVVSLLQLRNVAQLIGKGTCRFYSQCFVGQLTLRWLWLPWCRPPLSCPIDLLITLEVFAKTASYLCLHVSLKKDEGPESGYG